MHFVQDLGPAPHSLSSHHRPPASQTKYTYVLFVRSSRQRCHLPLWAAASTYPGLQLQRTVPSSCPGRHIAAGTTEATHANSVAYVRPLSPCQMVGRRPRSSRYEPTQARREPLSRSTHGAENNESEAAQLRFTFLPPVTLSGRSVSYQGLSAHCTVNVCELAFKAREPSVSRIVE